MLTTSTSSIIGRDEDFQLVSVLARRTFEGLDQTRGQ